MKSKFSFQTKILIGVSTGIILLVAALSTAFLMYSTKTITDTEKSSYQQLVEKTSSQVDALYQLMDVAATSVINDNDLVSMISTLNLSENLNVTSQNVNSQILGRLQTIEYYIPDAIKIAVFNSEKGYYFSVGNVDNDPQQVKNRENDVDWYQSLFSLNEQIKILPPHQNEWSRTPQTVLSLFKPFRNFVGQIIAVFEIQLPYSSLEKICNMETSFDQNMILLFDDGGSMVFPYGETSNLFGSMTPESIYSVVSAVRNQPVQFEKAENNVLLSYNKSEYTGLTTVIVSGQSALAREHSFYLGFTLAAGMLIILITVSAYHILIARLTKPLKSLIATVRDVKLENLSLEIQSKGQNEFELLNESFSIMFSNLKDSINQLYESRIHETNAHMMALQAQMNPHFLFNMLNVISASGEEQGNSDIVRMCSQLSAMMRYIVSPTNERTALENEAIHTKNYLELMKTHYEDYLLYEIQIPAEMNSISIPRNTIQPIVENSISHGFENTQPPWKLNVKGFIYEDGSWRIEIKDNGTGFSLSALTSLNEKMDEYCNNIKHGNFTDNLSIGGLGLLNTFARFYIQFKGHTVFTIHNEAPKGCKIIIGFQARVNDEEA